MKKLIPFLLLLLSCSSNLNLGIEYSQEGVTSIVTTNKYTKRLKRAFNGNSDEKLVSKIETKYKDKEKGTVIDYYLVTSISENVIYQRLTHKENIWTKNYHNISHFLNSVRNLKVEVENGKFERIVLSEEKDELDDNDTDKYNGKRYVINSVEVKAPENTSTKEIIFKNDADEVIKISYEKIKREKENEADEKSIMSSVFVKEKETENYFAVKATVKDEKAEIIGVYYHFYNKSHENDDLNDILPFADNPADIQLTLVRNKEVTSKEKIFVSNSFRIEYDRDKEILKGRDNKVFHENVADSPNPIENILSFYTILDLRDFIRSFANKEGVN